VCVRSLPEFAVAVEVVVVRDRVQNVGIAHSVLIREQNQKPCGFIFNFNILVASETI
jgi:hypothetical protein